MPEVFQDLHFPKAGIDLLYGFAKQMPRPLPDGTYARTTPVGQNVRAYEAAKQRRRGGSRPGLAKYIATQPNGLSLVQELGIILSTANPPPGGHMQLSQSGRVVTLVAVSQGQVFIANSGDAAWTGTTNGTAFNPPLNSVGVVFSAANQQKLWFADGVHACFYDPVPNSVNTWVASAGQLPTDGAGNRPRLIATWRGRTVQSGLIFDPQNWFMSAVGDPTNYDYSPLSTTQTQAVAGNNSSLGNVGDVITSLVAYSDDVLIFGGDHTLWMLRGDPMAGGQLDLITDAIGMAWGIPWCKDPYGTVYFVSNRTGIYSLVPGQQPQRISQAIEQLLLPIDTGANTIRLIWDDRYQGLHVFVTATAAAAATTHFFYEQRTGAWWTDVFANSNHNPLCCATLDGNTPGDRVALIGSWDGYVRAISPTATTDDGTAIQSNVILGPLLTKDLDDVLIKDLQAVMGTASGSVSYNVLLGATAEAAVTSSAAISGTWTAGRNFTNHIRRAAHALYVQITASGQWSMEQVRARITPLGKVRRRGR